tara:strand:- start:180 stop:461 length:282 start_codon:yes stop_codon:yes gene_type:complete
MSQKVYVLKLKSGDELIARIDTENMEPTIVLDQPMGIQVMMQQGNQPGFAMLPWMMASADKKFTISSDQVLTKGKARDEMEKQYLSAITGLSL